MPPKKSEKIFPIYVIAGDAEEPGLLDQECERLLDELLAGHDRSMALLRADADNLTAAELFDELRTLPFLSPKRVVLMRSAEKFISKYREQLEKYFENPSSSGIFIMVVNTWDSRLKLAKKLPQVGMLIEVGKCKAFEIPNRLTEYAKERHNKSLSNTAGRLLVEIAGDNLSRLYNEIDKLALYANEKPAITEQDVESLVGHNRLFSCFNVIDAIIAGNTGVAVDRLRKMFAEDKTAEYTFVGAFAFHFRRLFNAKGLANRGVNESAISTQLRVWDKGFFANLKKVSLQQIAENLMQLAQTDFAIKTGQTKPQVAAEQLVYSLTKK